MPVTGTLLLISVFVRQKKVGAKMKEAIDASLLKNQRRHRVGGSTSDHGVGGEHPYLVIHTHIYTLVRAYKYHNCCVLNSGSNLSEGVRSWIAGKYSFENIRSRLNLRMYWYPRRYPTLAKIWRLLCTAVPVYDTSNALSVPPSARSHTSLLRRHQPTYTRKGFPGAKEYSNARPVSYVPRHKGRTEQRWQSTR